MLIESFIKELGEDELRYLNRLVVERLKLIAQEKSTRSMSRFTDQDGRTITGLIVRLKKKTATVFTSDGAHWKVAPSLLRLSGGK